MVHDIEPSLDVAADIEAVRYMDRRHLTYEQYLDEPRPIVEASFLVWEKQGLRDLMETERQKQRSV